MLFKKKSIAVSSDLNTKENYTPFFLPLRFFYCVQNKHTPLKEFVFIRHLTWGKESSVKFYLKQPNLYVFLFKLIIDTKISPLLRSQRQKNVSKQYYILENKISENITEKKTNF